MSPEGAGDGLVLAMQQLDRCHIGSHPPRGTDPVCLGAEAPELREGIVIGIRYFTSSISPGFQVLSNHGSSGA
jgi:hypothetical protein